MTVRRRRRVIELGDGTEAINGARNAKRLDLALIDVRMPGTDGLNALRGDPKTRGLPSVMMTASMGTKSSRFDVEALGAMPLLKRFAAELDEAIAGVLDRSPS